MKKTKRILALIGAILLAGLYLSTLIFAFIDHTATLIFLKTSVAATIFFPVMLYVMTLIYKRSNEDNDKPN